LLPTFLSGPLDLLLPPLELPLSLCARRIIQKGLLLPKLLELLLKLLALLLELALLLLHFLLHLLLNVLHPRHTPQNGPLIDISNLLGLRRACRHRGNEKEKRKGFEYSF